MEEAGAARVVRPGTRRRFEFEQRSSAGAERDAARRAGDLGEADDLAVVTRERIRIARLEPDARHADRRRRGEGRLVQNRFHHWNLQRTPANPAFHENRAGRVRLQAAG